MFKSSTLILIITSLFLFSCKNNEREKMLDRKEQALMQREKQFAKKQLEYQRLLKMRDSLMALNDSIQDTIQGVELLPKYVLGSWKSKIVCTASGCGNYVIGDTKTNETWVFAKDSLGITLATYNNTKLLRIYKGKYDGSSIYLHSSNQVSPGKSVEMKVQLNKISKSEMSGNQTITIDSSCTTDFTVRLLPIVKSTKS